LHCNSTKKRAYDKALAMVLFKQKKLPLSFILKIETANSV